MNRCRRRVSSWVVELVPVVRNDEAGVDVNSAAESPGISRLPSGAAP
jgi:hypothetical protein